MGRSLSSGGRLRAALSRPVDGASLAVFRGAFGLLMAGEALRHLLAGRVFENYVEPSFHFTWTGFHWVAPWGAAGMVAHFALLVASALALAAGLWTRVAALLFGTGFLYVFLLEKARYLNHYYLVLLLAALLVLVPAGSCWSVDAWRRRRREGRRTGPAPAGAARMACAVPAWGLILLRGQIGLVYLHAALAKVNPDWLRGRPLGAWLASRADHPVLGPLLAEPYAAWLFSYGGLLIDLLAWPGLLWRRTRTPTFLVLLAFHLTNSTLFGIGVFPWLMIAATTLFLEPDWPRRLLRRRAADARASPAPPMPAGVAAPDGTPLRVQRWVPAVVVAWLAFQTLFPLRHWLYPGSVHWTEEGHAFAWHMKLRSKQGRAIFRVADPLTGEVLLVDPRVELLPWQADRMAGRPDMLLQYAHHLAERFSPAGGPRVEVRATVPVSLNGHPERLLVDPTVDLAAVRWSLLRPSPWIRR